MNELERKLLLATAKDMVGLFQDRDDLLVGLVAALLDVYRTLIAAGIDTKDSALVRLAAQREQITSVIPGATGVKSLQWLIGSLETGKLDAAKLYREPTAGTA